MIKLTTHINFDLTTQAWDVQQPNEKISHNFTSHQFTRKPLIAEILIRWLLVGKKVPYKFRNDLKIVDPSCHKSMIRLSAQKWQITQMAIARTPDL